MNSIVAVPPVAVDVFPTLTLAEKQRRYDTLTDWMSRDGLDALLIFGNGRESWDSYVSNEALHATALLTARGDAALIGGFPLARLDPSGAGYERWIDDVRVGPLAPRLQELLHEHGLSQNSTIGVVGFTALGFGQQDGSVRWTTWRAVLDLLPDVTFVDAAGDFERIVMVKSVEEREMVRKAAAIGEVTCEAFLDAVRVGARESQVAGAALGATVAAGGWSPEPVICLRAGRDRFSWGRPEWIGTGGGGRVLQQGDSIAAELFCFYAGFESQQQIEAYLGEPEPIVRALEAVCLEAYAAGMSLITRPGVTFSELADVMMEPMLREGYWNTGPQVHGMGPCWPNTTTHVNTASDPALADAFALPPVRPQDGDVTIVPGMTFAFEPNAIHNLRRVCIGGTVLITEDGIEELNHIAKTIHVV